MPTYDYLCRKCGRRFSKHMLISEHEKAKVTCPKCGSRRVEQQISAFFAQTSKKS
jgi:putative FmdB family regulatory protein